MSILPILAAGLALLSLASAQDASSGEIATIFRMFDFNENRIITKVEFESYFQRYDENEDTVITRQEYLDIFEQTMPSYEILANTLFSTFDINKDEKLEESDFDAFWPVIDVDGDSLVTIYEFQGYFGEILA